MRATIPAYFTRDQAIESRRLATGVHRLPAEIEEHAPAGWLERRKRLEAAGSRYVGPDRTTRKRASQRDDTTHTWYIEKYSELMIEGAASTGALDSHNTRVDPAGMECDGLPLPLYWAHDDQKQIGEVVYLKRLESVILARATVFDHETNVAAEIRSGRLHCWSVKFKPLEPPAPTDGAVLEYRHWKLEEISLTFQGANPEAIFGVWTPPHRRAVRLIPNETPPHRRVVRLIPNER